MTPQEETSIETIVRLGVELAELMIAIQETKRALESLEQKSFKTALALRAWNENNME